MGKCWRITRELFFLCDLTIRRLKRFSGICLSASLETSGIIHFSNIIKIYYIIKRRMLNMCLKYVIPIYPHLFSLTTSLSFVPRIPIRTSKTIFSILKNYDAILSISNVTSYNHYITNKRHKFFQNQFFKIEIFWKNWFHFSYITSNLTIYTFIHRNDIDCITLLTPSSTITIHNPRNIERQKRRVTSLINLTYKALRRRPAEGHARSVISVLRGRSPSDGINFP